MYWGHWGPGKPGVGEPVFHHEAEVKPVAEPAELYCLGRVHSALVSMRGARIFRVPKTSCEPLTTKA